MFPPGLDLGRQVYDAYWTVLRPVVERLIIEDGFLTGRRGVGSIGWSAIQTRQEGLFCALSEILRQKNSASFFQKGKGCLVDGILWRRS